MGSSLNVTHTTLLASGCVSFTRCTTSSIADSVGWPLAYMLVPGMLRKLMAPRTESNTRWDSESHWSDLRSVLFDGHKKSNTLQTHDADVPFSQNDSTPILRQLIRPSGTLFKERTLTTWSLYSSPSSWPPAISTSFFCPATRDLSSVPDLDKRERSLTGAKILSLEPYVLRRKLIWL
jgi:hypothetical protein